MDEQNKPRGTVTSQHFDFTIDLQEFLKRYRELGRIPPHLRPNANIVAVYTREGKKVELALADLLKLDVLDANTMQPVKSRLASMFYADYNAECVQQGIRPLSREGRRLLNDMACRLGMPQLCGHPRRDDGGR